MPTPLAADDVVRTREEAAANEREPLLVLQPLLAFLDERGLGDGDDLLVEPVGEGHSNVTFLLQRGEARWEAVIRRPPRGPLPPSAHDVLREARVLRATAGQARVPEV
ncbi:MAG TPA: phosphotransferase, partial [Solirubrobacteraceae bacterium]|nr:phosphotransferase [Solirubrobacteraceae bacterium]